MITSLFCIVDEGGESMRAVAQEVFMYKGWECTVMSTNGDDV